MQHEASAQVQLGDTDIQAMMLGGFEAGTQRWISENYKVVCLDGAVWEIQTRDEVVVGTINPTNVATCDDLATLLQEIVAEGDGWSAVNYRSLAPSD